MKAKDEKSIKDEHFGDKALRVFFFDLRLFRSVLEVDV